MTATAERTRTGIPAEQPPPGTDLTEAPQEVPDAFKDAVFDRLRSCAWRRYPARRQSEIVGKVATELALDPDRVLLTRGCTEALRLAFAAEVARGRRLWLPRPSYFGFAMIAESLRAECAQYALSTAAGDGVAWPTMSEEDVIVLCTPNNPTGHRVDAEGLETARGAGGAVVDLTYDLFEDEPLLAAAAERTGDGATVACLSLSKAYALAGARLGVMVAAPDRLREYRALTDTYRLDYFQLAVLDVLFGDEGREVRTAVTRRARALRTEIAGLVGTRLPDLELLAVAGNFVTVRPIGPGAARLTEAIAASAAAKTFASLGLIRLTAAETTVNVLTSLAADATAATSAGDGR